MSGESATGMQSDWREPELGAPIAPLDMHMHLLRPIARVEEEPVRPYSEKASGVILSPQLIPDRRSLTASRSAAAGSAGRPLNRPVRPPPSDRLARLEHGAKGLVGSRLRRERGSHVRLEENEVRPLLQSSRVLPAHTTFHGGKVVLRKELV